MKSCRSLLGFVYLAFCYAAVAQSTNASLTGFVDDPSKAVITKATITAINTQTGVKTKTATNTAGQYVLPNLVPGTYRLEVDKQGFKGIIEAGLVLHTQDVLQINFHMAVGSMSETVTVNASDANINTTDASVSTVIDRQFVENLPLNGRSFNTLLQLTPGVVIVPNPSTSTQTGQFSISGQRSDANSFTVDGVSANFGTAATLDVGQSGTGSSQAFSAFGGTSSLVSVDALQEFRIETSSFAPEFGKTPGGQVMLTTRSGTNQLHGAVFDYFRNTVMDANNWFSDTAIPQIAKAAEHHNDFGGVVGGPIWKGKTFFFASYEGARLDLPATSLIQVPYYGAGISGCSPSAVVLPFLQAYPLPNGTLSASTCTGQFSGSYSNKGTLDAGSIRIDHTFNDKFSIFGRYNDAPSQIAQRTFDLSTIQTTTTNTQTGTAGVNMAFSGRLFNALRGNYSTQNAGTNFTMDSYGGATPPSLSVYTGTLPGTVSEGLVAPLDGTQDAVLGPNANNQIKQFNLVDDLSYTFGTHQLKFGVDYRILTADNAPVQYQAEYLFLSIKSLISSGQAYEFGLARQNPSQIRSQSTSFYAQDSWKASHRLVLTYGLRWELSPAPKGLGSTSLASWTNVNNPSAIALAPLGTSLWQTTYGNIAPRVGIAYTLDPAGSLVLRVGAGVFYDLGSSDASNLATFFPNAASVFFLSQNLPVTNISSMVPTISTTAPYTSAAVYGFDPNLKLPRSYQWNLAIEKAFANHQALSVTYVGQTGTGLIRDEALYKPNPNFIGSFILEKNTAWSNYDALEVQYRRPLSARVQALLNYTYGHSLDNASTDVIIGLSDAVVSAANDYASSTFDVRQSFSGAVTYAIPSIGKSGVLAQITKDWSLDSVIVARTGFPINPQFAAPSTLGSANIRPDVVPGQPFYLYGAQCSQAFGPTASGGNGVLKAGQPCPGGKGLNPAAFNSAAPKAANRQGTLSRNAVPGFGLTQLDLSIDRKFKISDRFNFQFRADAFNLLNHPNFTNAVATVTTPSTLLSQSSLNNGLGGLSPLFQEGGPRSLQLSLRFAF